MLLFEVVAAIGGTAATAWIALTALGRAANTPDARFHGPADSEANGRARIAARPYRPLLAREPPACALPPLAKLHPAFAATLDRLPKMLSDSTPTVGSHVPYLVWMQALGPWRAPAPEETLPAGLRDDVDELFASARALAARLEAAGASALDASRYAGELRLLNIVAAAYQTMLPHVAGVGAGVDPDLGAISYALQHSRAFQRRRRFTQLPARLPLRAWLLSWWLLPEVARDSRAATRIGVWLAARAAVTDGA